MRTQLNQPLLFDLKHDDLTVDEAINPGDEASLAEEAQSEVQKQLEQISKLETSRINAYNVEHLHLHESTVEANDLGVRCLSVLPDKELDARVAMYGSYLQAHRRITLENVASKTANFLGEQFG